MSDPIGGLPFPDEADALKALLNETKISQEIRAAIRERAIGLVKTIRHDSDPGMMELFLGEYGLSSEEGVALMCLAEALLRVPDGATMDALIEDKIAPSEWGKHLGKSHSSLVNASTWALFVTGKVLKDDDGGDPSIAGVLHGAIKRLGEPIIRQAVSRVMKEMGRQFVLGETIEKAMNRATAKQREGFTYSYDMLGEAAITMRDAKRYHLAYADAISEIAKDSKDEDIRSGPGISIKLSALHPRYETMKRERVLRELVPSARSLAMLAKSAGIGLNIDAEEAGRLELSLDVIEAILSDAAFEGWEGFGVVVQAYNVRAPYVIDRLYRLAEKLDRKIMVRLVKGAYWDTEIKLSQTEAHERFPVFTQKASTDVSYICCAEKLLGMTDRIYPQFATHNAHTVAAILEIAGDKSAFEIQRLHGMGEALHDTVLKRHGTRCRIYAPVGAHKDLLAYLVRRLLENGANSSFVNQIVDEDVPPEEVAADPFERVLDYVDAPQNPAIRQPSQLFSPERQNSNGEDLQDPATLDRLEKGLASFDQKTWFSKSGSGEKTPVLSPATGEKIGDVQFANDKDIQSALQEIAPWESDAEMRAKALERTADFYEENADEIHAILMNEAGKTLLDCIGEVREAVDFLRYYANEARIADPKPAGIFTCISPWNFPLAIFTGQVAAALAAGNGVLAKPAESTNLIADLAVKLMHSAGVPTQSLKLLCGTGESVGAALTSNAKISGVCFTGSTATAQAINKTMANTLSPDAPLIAETGGLNAMIIDSTALPEQAIRDVMASAFQSAGQRCSALRVLYLQKDVADEFLKMLYGAMDELSVGDPRDFSTDIGPIININAAGKIRDYINAAKDKGCLLKQIKAPEHETFVAPAVIKVSGIEDLEEEVFGPVLHVATFDQADLDHVIAAINAKGFGLTFGLHSRIDDRVQHVIDRVEAGNLYINRNQIGAVVGSQPFGGEGLSGTGPKAGGPRYLTRFTRQETIHTSSEATGPTISEGEIIMALKTLDQGYKRELQRLELPGPTGESNVYSVLPRGLVLCLGPTAEMAMEQKRIADELGCKALAIAPGLEAVPGHLAGVIDIDALKTIEHLDAVVSWNSDTRAIRRALSERDGPIVSLLSDKDFGFWLVKERHVCIDTTAAGGNAALLAG